VELLAREGSDEELAKGAAARPAVAAGKEICPGAVVPQSIRKIKLGWAPSFS